MSIDSRPIEETVVVAAAPAAPVAPVAPVIESERIDALDVLRGVALLGILVMNIQSFSMIGAAYMNPTAYGDLTGANFTVWLVSHLFFDMKFYTMFSMMFGAGIVLMSERLEGRGRGSAGVHYRRMGWLILFGLLHAHLLWYGDILYTYGMCGLVVWLFRRWRPSWLIALGLGAVAVGSLLAFFFGLTMESWAESARLQEGWSPSAELVQEDLDAYRGGWLDQAPRRSMGALFFETFLLLTNTGWRSGGLMLIGMALYKMRVFSAARSAGLYATLVAAALLVGVPIVYWGVQRHMDAGWDMYYSFFLGTQFNYWASILVSLGWVGAVMLFVKSGALAIVRTALAAVGRMALTNYLMHTVICTTLFYGHGFGLFGSVERTGQIGIVLAIWAFQLVASPIWLTYFRFGPAEWLWRTLTYWRLQPMRR